MVFTLSAVDLKRPDMIQTIARQYGVHFHRRADYG